MSIIFFILNIINIQEKEELIFELDIIGMRLFRLIEYLKSRIQSFKF